MFSGYVQNNKLTIFSNATITGFDTSRIYVFENNSFQTFSTASLDITSKQLSLILNKSIIPDANVTARLYSGGITTTTSFGTTFNISNVTTFYDNQSPSLFEMIEQQNYSFTSYIYSNLVTGITTAATNPVANIVLKRNAPIGKITINEGYQGIMQVRRFAALSSPVLSIGGTSPLFNVPRNFAFNLISNGNFILNSVDVGFTSFITGLTTGANAYLSLNQDFAGNPSSVSLGISSIIDFSTKTSNFTCNFAFDPPITVPQGIYWLIFTPTSDSNLPSGNIASLNNSLNNYYSDSVLTSSDGFNFSNAGVNGLGNFNINTQSGFVLPTNDSIYNQLDQPQNIKVTYGDATDLNTYVSLAVPVTSHYIKKTLRDPDTGIYALEVLANGGSNAYEVTGLNTGGNYTQYFSMIANPYTTNVVRYEFLQPLLPSTIDSLYLNSLGDYYASGTQGNVLVSARDFLGISKIEVSTNPTFPQSNTKTITTDNVTTYLENVPYNFGNVGTKYNTISATIASNIKYVFEISYQSATAFIILTNDTIYLYQNTTSSIITKFTNSNITSAIFGPQGIVISDTIGKIYNLTTNSLQLYQVGTIPNGTPISMALVSQSVYIGTARIKDSSDLVSDRRRIYLLSNFSYSTADLVDISWSRQISEPEITFIYNSQTLGLIIGAYDQVNLIGRVYLYANGTLSPISFSTSATYTFLRPDFAYFSNNSQNLYVGYSNLANSSSTGSQIYYAKYSANSSNVYSLGTLNDTGISVAGTQVLSIAPTNVTNKVAMITNQSSYVFDETIFTSIPLALPSYTANDTRGLLFDFQNNDLNLSDYLSYVGFSTFSAFNYTFDLSTTKSFSLEASGFIVFDNLDPTGQTGYSTSFYLNYPNTITSIQSFTYDGKAQSGNVLSDTFYYQQPKSFHLKMQINVPSNSVGLATFSLHNGVNSSSPVVGISSLTPVKSMQTYLKTGGTYDYFTFADGSLRTAKVSDLISNLYKVYARFTDINNVVTASNDYAYDTIYNQKQQQQSGQTASSGIIYELNTSSNNPPNSYVPISGQSNLVYAGSKIARASGIYESEPYFASDATSWGSLQAVCIIPGYNSIDVGSFVEYGTSVTIYIKTSETLNGLLNSQYTYSETISTIDNQALDYDSGVNISASLSAFKGTWIQFKVVLTTASPNVNPIVKSILITYNGAGQSVFVTKTFDTTVQTNAVPPPLMRRGILTANFVTNGGQISFAYSTNPDADVSSYINITPNQIFTLPAPSSQIKFAAILKSATSSPCFIDEFAVQMDLGLSNNLPADVYFMPPMAAFEIQKYYDNNNNPVQYAYEFVNKSVGIVSSYNWSFGTSSIGITEYIPADSPTDPAIHRTNPIVVFSNPGPFTVGLSVTGFVQNINGNNVIFNSELFSQVLNAS